MMKFVFNLLRSQAPNLGTALFLIIVNFLEERISGSPKKEKKVNNEVLALPPAEKELQKTKKPFSLMKTVFWGTTLLVVVPTSTVFAGGFFFRGVFIPQNQTVTVECGGKTDKQTVKVPKGSTVKCSGIEIVTPK